MFYHYSEESAFRGLLIQCIERLIAPGESVQDTTDYIKTSNALCPGISVEYTQATGVGSSAEVSIGTTAGFLLRDTHGHERLTVCNHASSIAMMSSIHPTAALESGRLTNAGRHSTLLC